MSALAELDPRSADIVQAPHVRCLAAFPVALGV
jgi:hypothetical protein